MQKTSGKKRKEKWSEFQDLTLSSLVSQFGAKEWSAITSEYNAKFPYEQKSKKQCRARWQIISQESAKEPWTDKEEFFLLLAHSKQKNHWANIAESLKGRNNGSTKNRFYSIFRRVKNQIVKSNFDYSSKLELLQVLYIISVIEYYFEHPLDINAPKRRRGIDFAYTLISNLTTGQIKEFKEKLLEKSKHEGTLEELFKEIENSYKTTESVDGSDKNNVPTKPNLHHQTKPIVFPDNMLQNAKQINNCEFLSSAKENFPEISPLFEHMEPDKTPIFSPTSLSAGPAAAAAAARMAGCFKSPSCFSKFSGDFSNITKNFLHVQQPKIHEFLSNPPRIQPTKPFPLCPIPIRGVFNFHEPLRRYEQNRIPQYNKAFLDDIPKINKH